MTDQWIALPGWYVVKKEKSYPVLAYNPEHGQVQYVDEDGVSMEPLHIFGATTVKLEYRGTERPIG